MIKTTLFPHGTKPFRYAQNNDNEETQLLALGQTIMHNDKSEGDEEANDNNDDSSALLDDLGLGEWTFTDGSPAPPAGSESDEDSIPVDYESESETGSVSASDNE